MSMSASTSMSGKGCVALRGKKKMELKKNEWERLCGLGGEEKDGTEEEGIFVAGIYAEIGGTLRGPRGPKN